jgi:glycosyltransferase involved in cell wall biosynthesis
MYPPLHNAGAEWMAHAMNTYLVNKQGWNVNVVLNKTWRSEFERVQILDKKDSLQVEECIQNSAVLISHLDMEPNAVLSAAKAKRPMVLVMHNNYRTKYVRQFKFILGKNLYLIHNSNWIQKYYASFGIPSIVVYPPVYYEEYRTETSGEYVTLINLNRNKGGDVLIKIAKEMPDIQFMGVIGGYDGQIQDTTVKNITYVENTSYIKSIYSQSSIILMPSKEESWGRVAIEAMSSGIPVIATPTPGLLESCGSAGIFCKRDDIGSWVREIRRLKTDTEYYKSVSEKCFERAKELDPLSQLTQMEAWLKELRWRD